MARRDLLPAHGVLLLDKPAGMSSNQALQKARWLLQAPKAGHTGVLDPFATGLLPLCFGEATKFSQRVLDAKKRYSARLQFGAYTETGDPESAVVTVPCPVLTQAEVDAAVRGMLGLQQQLPPMFSALKHQGRPLYEYARAGVELAREQRQIDISAFDVRLLDGLQAELQVECSKGTYVRTLADDLAKSLGTRAYLLSLRRHESAGLSLAQAHTLDALEALPAPERRALLLPADLLVRALPKVVLNLEASLYWQQGQAVWIPGVQPQGELRVYRDDGFFLGLGYLDVEGKIAPKRVMTQALPGLEPEF